MIAYETESAELVESPMALLHAQGQSLWLDNITRGLLSSGTLQGYIKNFVVTGLTSNPTIFEQAVRLSKFYDEGIQQKAGNGKAPEDIFFDLALEDLVQAADLFRPVHDATDGIDGWVSLEVSPLLANDVPGTIFEAAQLHTRADRPNLFIKIPGTPSGLQAIEESIFAGVPVNVTLLFSREQYLAAAFAYLRGLERRLAQGLDLRVSSVASIFVSRWDVAANDKVPAALRNRLGVAIAQRTYTAYLELLASPRWQKLAAAGAHPQRLLWASTGTKDPAAPDTFYVNALAAPNTINTMPEKTLLAYADHGVTGDMMDPAGGAAERVIAGFALAGINATVLAEQLQAEGTAAFSKSWAALLEVIASRTRIL